MLRVEAAPDPIEFIDHPSGFLALSPRNRRFGVPGMPGFIAYREQGRHLVVFGGVHAPAGHREPLLDHFLAEAVARRRRVLAVQVREPQCQLFEERGFTLNRLGTSFGLTLCRYTLRGGRKMTLRNKIHRARHAGLSIVELGREAPRDATAFAALIAISAAWLGGKRRQELDFMTGEIGAIEEDRRRVFVALEADGRAVAFITYVPAWGERPGFLHDLTRRLPSAPVGAMDLCNAVAIERMACEGVPFLHLGFTPFVGNGPERPGASRLGAFAVRVLARYGAALYPAVSQAQYKIKWGPDIVEPEYLAARPLSARGVFDLLRLTRSL